MTMAVPTITSITPSTGPATGGYLIEIVGTNFAVPVLSYDVPAEALAPRVRVTIDGTACSLAQSLGATRILAVAPRYTGDCQQTSFPAVNVTVQNLTAAGMAIPGELATLTGGFTYARWGLHAPRRRPPLLLVLLDFIARMKREVTLNIAKLTHVDYGEYGMATEVRSAALPSLGIRVAMPEDKEYADEDNGFERITQDDGSINLFRGMRTHQLVLDLIATGEGDAESNQLCQAILDSIALNPYIQIAADTVLYPGLLDTYPIEITRMPEQADNPNNIGTSAFSMQVRIRGVRTMPDYPVDKIFTMAQAYLVETNMDGDDPTVRELFQ